MERLSDVVERVSGPALRRAALRRPLAGGAERLLRSLRGWRQRGGLAIGLAALAIAVGVGVLLTQAGGGAGSGGLRLSGRCRSAAFPGAQPSPTAPCGSR